ncbi:MAG: hypothetical protein QG639_645 [Patescibacteria group bacterium]|nr:hypothetical protein [Patescibacteria group bacterium]
MIISEIKKHLVSYTVLLIGIIAFCSTFFMVWPDRFKERITVIAFALFYILWGIATHAKKKQITSKVISEYVFVSVIGALLLLMLTF